DWNLRLDPLAALRCPIPRCIAWRSRSRSSPDAVLLPMGERVLAARPQHRADGADLLDPLLAGRLVVRRIPSPPSSVWLRCLPVGATDGPASSPVGGQYHGVAYAGRWSEVADDEVLDLREAAILPGLDEGVVARAGRPGNRAGRVLGGAARVRAR